MRGCGLRELVIRKPSMSDTEVLQRSVEAYDEVDGTEGSMGGPGLEDFKKVIHLGR